MRQQENGAVEESRRIEEEETKVLLELLQKRVSSGKVFSKWFAPGQHSLSIRKNEDLFSPSQAFFLQPLFAFSRRKAGNLPFF